MPAAAVIPAPVAYIKVVAVKKLVVGFLNDRTGPPSIRGCVAGMSCSSFQRADAYHSLGRARAIWIFYFEKIRVFKAGLRYEYISME